MLMLLNVVRAAKLEPWKLSESEWPHNVNMRLLVSHGNKVRTRILREDAKSVGKKL
jgi:hypothetical protein